MRTLKLTAEHLRRRAVVYVRQSTSNQVHENAESKRRQYGLTTLAREMGFESVTVIDDDLGRSGSGRVKRPGFERLFADLGNREVSAVFCLEASRLARNGREWHTLLDLCGLVEAVIVDPDGVYDPRNGNDRLMLGLKGTLSEYELTLLRQRALVAVREKAARGELRFVLPVGVCWTQDGRIELHPDLRIQEAVRLVYRKYAELGSMRSVLLWFHEQRLSLPTLKDGRIDNEIIWALPVYSTIHRLLTSPFYAGAYVWGRTTRRPARPNDKPRPWLCRPQEEWEVLLTDHHPGYITWDEFLRIRNTMAQNAHMNPWGPPKAGRGGTALLGGLLRCRRCGRRFNVLYGGRNHPRYVCPGGSRQDGSKCIAFSGVHVDAAISAEVLKVVAEPALEAALLAANTTTQRQRDEGQAMALELEQARYRARLAERRYEHVDPDNRLIAAELERRWNEALACVEAVEQRLEQHRHGAVERPSHDRDQLLGLAKRLPEVWNDDRTDARAKQRIVRVLIEEVIADVDLDKGEVLLVVRWAGGRHSELRAKRRRLGQHRLTTCTETIEIVRRMGPYWNDRQIAATLNRLGIKTATGLAWTAARVTGVRYATGLTDEVLKAAADNEPSVTLIEASRRLGTSTITVRRLITTKILAAEQIVPFAPWRVPIAALEKPEVVKAVAAINKPARPRLRSGSEHNLRIPGL